MSDWGGSRNGSGRRPATEDEREAARLRYNALKRERRKNNRETSGASARESVPHQAKTTKAKAQPRSLSFDDIAALVELSKQTARQKVREKGTAFDPYKLPAFPPIAIPKDAALQMKATGGMAMDSSLGWGSDQWVGAYLNSVVAEGLSFPGYNYLAELAQRPEYRTFAEIISTEMTRKWIKFSAVSGDKAQEQDDAENAAAKARGQEPGEQQQAIEQTSRVQGAGEPEKKRPGEGGIVPDKKANETEEKIQELVDFMEDLRVRDHFASIAAQDCFFGRTHLYLDNGIEDPNELMTPIADMSNNTLFPAKVKKKFLKRLKVIEPVWTYPTTYNATNPLLPDWYDPQVWYVMGQQIHKSRLPMFQGRPVPDLLKPSYAFGGISLSQLAQPYVDIWLTTRQSVADLIKSFSTMVLMADLQTMMQPGGSGAAGLVARATLFNALRDNQGLMLINNATEDFKNVSVPLSGLSDLQAQSQEHMMSVARIPAVKFTGMQPLGLNASSEGEIRAFYDTIKAYQHKLFKSNLDYVIDICQITLWGKKDPDITYEFEDLWEVTEKDKADLRKANAETGKILIEGGVIDPAEERGRIVNDTDSQYDGLDPDEVPEPPEDPAAEGGEDPFGNKSDGPDGAGGDPDSADNDNGGAELSVKIEPKKASGGASDADPFGLDATWTEGDHPRGQPGNAGQFGKGGGGSGSKAKEKKQSLKAPQFGLTPTPKESHQNEPDDGSKYFKENWAKSGSVGGHSQPTKKQVETYEKAYLGQGKEEPAAEKPAELEPKALTRVGKQMGSNPGGVFENAAGERFYVKQGRSEEHVKNELAAVALAKLAGARTLEYAPVKGGKHIASKMQKLDKSKAADLSPEERKEAAQDFVAHAWLGNWDSVGTGGDNIGTIKGKPTSLDMGGALLFRAQGAPKGKAFGPDVSELKTMRDPQMSPDAAKVYGKMTEGELRSSAKKVLSVPDDAITATVKDNGLPEGVAKTLIARKASIAKQLGMAMDETDAHGHEHAGPGPGGGQFVSQGGGGGGSTEEETEKEEPEGKVDIAGLLKKNVVAGSNYRKALVKALAVADAEQKKALTGKLIESWEKTRANFASKGDDKTVKAIAKKIQKLGGQPKLMDVTSLAKPSPPAPITPATVKAAMEKNDVSDLPAPTAAELQKAKKGTKYPTTSASTAEGSHLIEKFNQKYAGKDLTNPDQLAQKIQDFKAMVAGVEHLNSQKVIKEKQAVQKAAEEQAAKEKAELDKIMSDPDAKAAYVEMDAVTHGKGFTDEYIAKATEVFKNSQYANAGKQMSSTERGAIIAYTGSKYRQINSSLREGVMTKDQYAFTKNLNNGLAKLPPFKGKVFRKADLTAQQFKLYQTGMIVEERAFTSSSKNSGTWSGQYRYEIDSLAGRDVQPLSSHKSEAEVLFRSGSRFEVLGVEGNLIKMKEVPIV